jgi:hypothetical protein
MEREPSLLHEYVTAECHADESIDLSEKLRTECVLWVAK